ncbi:MAG: hypothetical protein QXE31_04545 [Candidatus Woesearchaeota archaeon]
MILESEKIKNFILSNKQKDGGFSFTKESSPCFIEQIYLASEALCELKSKPKDINNYVKLIQSFKANNDAMKDKFLLFQLWNQPIAVFCLIRLSQK